MDEKSKVFLNQFLESLADAERQKYHSFSADYFCADQYNANVCADLICIGQKTATCSLKYWYDSGLEPMPQVGHLMVVTDWYGTPVCIIETDSVKMCRYIDVSANFAYLEGEGDRSLAWWHKTHWNFFQKECKELDIQPSDEMMLVLEHFHVVYQ